ncbi:MAG: metal ABC transporter permease [Actinobacteria bacterium]|nr:metal ABC transporter permease [Actinomycetota bacterium]
MRSALVAVVLVSLSCATLGAYVVLRRMAFLGDALAHTAMPGVVVAYLAGWSLFGGAIAAGVVTALAVGWISRRGLLREDSAIGLVFTALFALGILLISTTASYRDLSHILFGNVLGVTTDDIVALAIVAAVVLGLVAVLHKELELTSFDSTHARVMGLDADRLRQVLLVALALAVVAGIQAVGVVLTSALLVTPAATASLVARTLPRMMAIGLAVAIVAGIGGLYASYYAEVSSGAAIVLANTACFAAVLAGRTVRRRSTRRRLLVAAAPGSP